jgi:ABC-type glycerol-3-phosphate transport system permease component
MSHDLLICLIAVGVNLAGMLLIYSAMSFGFARLVWLRRGSVPLLGLIVVAQLFWIAPALWIVEGQGVTRTGSYALWFGNWLVCGFGIVLLLKSAARIPVALNDAARSDGLGGMATWRHTILPFVRPDLVVLALLTVMATLLPFWGVINQPEASNAVTLFERGATSSQHLIAMFASSLLGVVPLAAIFLAARKTL